MSYDPESVTKWSGAIARVFTGIKALITLFPSGKKKAEAERLLREAELAAKRAEADFAASHGYPLCPYCGPTEFMVLSPQTNQPIYRECGRGLPPSDSRPKVTTR
jgi:hypothetical protein